MSLWFLSGKGNHMVRYNLGENYMTIRNCTKILRKLVFPLPRFFFVMKMIKIFFKINYFSFFFSLSFC